MKANVPFLAFLTHNPSAQKICYIHRAGERAQTADSSHIQSIQEKKSVKFWNRDEFRIEVKHVEKAAFWQPLKHEESLRSVIY